MAVRPRRIAFALALAIIAWAVLLQYVLTPGQAAPPVIFFPIVIAWAAAAVLLWTKPRAGGVFTVILGLASAFGALQSHGAPLRWDNVVLAGLSLLAAATAAWLLWDRHAQFALT